MRIDLRTDIKFYLVVIALILCNLFVYKSIVTPYAPQAFTKEFPSQISDWTSEDVSCDEKVLNRLSPDKIIYKTYHGDGGPPITLFMGCYNTLEKADFSSSPIVCLTGQGWSISSVTMQEIPVCCGGTKSISVNQSIQHKAHTTMITLFWYESARGSFSNRGIQKLSLLYDRLLGKSDANAFVRLTMIRPENKPIEEITSYLFTFVQNLKPELRNFFS